VRWATGSWPEVRYVDFRTLLRLAQGIQGDPEVRDYSVLTAAVARHEAVLMGRPVFPRVLDASGALLHTIVALAPLTFGNEVFGWVAGYTMLGLNGAKVQADPREAIEFVQTAMAERWDERAIAERLGRFVVA
jgi:death on curing protein